MPDFELERAYLKKHPGAVIAGVDEAGRGPWAGPVMAAAVILDAEKLPSDLCDKLDDSKKLTAPRREVLFAALYESGAAMISIGHADVQEIDSVNILNATYRAMARAVEALNCKVALALVDGDKVPPLPCDTMSVIKGDGKSLSIAAASVIAKVTRDRLMTELAAACPGYGWETNMGYGTAKHQAAIAQLGITPHHRRSFAPIRVALGAAAVRTEFF
jgi:ribonuclease HII